MSKIVFYDPFEHLQHKLLQKERGGSQIANLTLDHKKSGIDLTSVFVDGV
jgi:hypothetical protein